MTMLLMRICRYHDSTTSTPLIGVINDAAQVVDLSPINIHRIDQCFDEAIQQQIRQWMQDSNPTGQDLDSLTLLAPVDRQEIWAAGVTYLRSKTARMEESDFSASAYDQVYDAPRPEIFFKSLPEKAVGPHEAVGIRKDAHWNVPEPELALIINAQGSIVGHTIGNDMSSRDIEGENLLYLPQAKMYDRSCSLGPWIVLGSDDATVRSWSIGVTITRSEEKVFSGDTSISQIKRSFQELADYLFRSQRFAHGAVLMTGTGVVPNDDFTLEQGDVVTIDISGIGSLTNPVIRV